MPQADSCCHKLKKYKKPIHYYKNLTSLLCVSVSLMETVSKKNLEKKNKYIFFTKLSMFSEKKKENKKVMRLYNFY